MAKAYRLLHAIFETAAQEDRIIARNPFHIEGAGKEESDEREIDPLPVVFNLRHTGGTPSAATGATLKELMARLGHSSMRAAMIYEHATRDRDQAIAKALGLFVRDARKAAEKPVGEPGRDQQGA